MSWQGIELITNKFNPIFKNVLRAVCVLLFSDILFTDNEFHGAFPLSSLLILSTYLHCNCFIGFI